MRGSFSHTRGPQDQGVRVTLAGIVANLALLCAKLAVGVFTGSVALVADGIHSVSDAATDLVVLGGIKLAARKPDARHPYGHGRYETFAGGLLAIALILVGLFIAWEAGRALYFRSSFIPTFPVLVVAGLSIGVKEYLYRRTIRAARRLGSTALHANAWHHRSDALSSVAVLIGGTVGLLGWGHADQVAGVLVGLMVSSSGVKTMMDVLHELTEGSLSPEELSRIKRAIENVPGVIDWHQLRSRRVGRETFLDVHVLVDCDLSVVEAHKISMLVERDLNSACRRPVNVLVHVEPDSPELSDHHNGD